MTIYESLMAKSAEWHKLADRKRGEADKVAWSKEPLNERRYFDLLSESSSLDWNAGELEALAKQVCAEARSACDDYVLASTVKLDIIGGPQ